MQSLSAILAELEADGDTTSAAAVQAKINKIKVATEATPKQQGNLGGIEQHPC